MSDLRQTGTNASKSSQIKTLFKRLFWRQSLSVAKKPMVMYSLNSELNLKIRL